MYFVMGVFRDKDYSYIIRKLCPYAEQIVTIETPDNPRALPAQELAEAFLDAAREANAEITDPNSPARNRLVEIHDHGSSYQRRLFDKVAPLPLADAASDLVWLAALMRDRADMYRPVEAARQSTR